jgi:hypothetical protein
VTRRIARGLAALLLALCALAAGGALAPGAASADLKVEAEDSWHADRSFDFQWQPSPPPGQPAQAAYRLYDSQGKQVRALTRSLGAMLDPFVVPPTPDAYTLEAWLEDAAGGKGAPSTATLRFDDTVPPPPALQPPAGWLIAIDAATLEIGPAPTPLPLSGLRGYAVSVDRGSAPCAGPTRCTADEVDLVGNEGSLSLGTLPEGVNFARVVAVSGSGVASPVATAELKVDGTPPLLSLHGAPAGWSDGPVKVTAVATDPLSGMAAAGPLGPFTAVAVDGASPARALGGSVTTWVTGSGVHEVEYFARDAAGNVADGSAGAPLPATATVRIDEDPPTVAFAAAQDPAEPERIEAFVDDSLSGPSRERGSIAVRLAGTRSRFEQLPTQVEGNRLVARWDSDSYPPGKYEFLATGFDLAGNAGTGTGRERGGTMVLVSPLKTPAFLEAGFLGKGTSLQGSRRARYGRGVRFGGRLSTAAGAPPAGLEVAVTEIFGPGAKPSRRTTYARTGADGRFEVRLAPGPSREVVAGFVGNRVLTRASGASARLEVPASVRLRASAATARIGGAPVVFTGRVAAAGTEAAAVKGLPVELQFRFRGGRWSEFRTVETDARGRFRYAYRFSDDDSRGVRFQFRAHVKGREGWPYGPGSSRPVSVTGR